MNRKKIRKLVSAFQNGKESVFDSLYSEWYDGQFYFACKMVRDRYAAEDITENAFATLYCRLKQTSPPDTPEKWLYRLTFRKCSRYLREREMEGRPVKYITACTGAGPLEDTLNGLPAEKMAAVILKYRCGYDNGDIAYVMNTTEDHVKHDLDTAGNILRGKRRSFPFLPVFQAVSLSLRKEALCMRKADRSAFGSTGPERVILSAAVAACIFLAVLTGVTGEALTAEHSLISEDSLIAEDRTIPSITVEETASNGSVRIALNDAAGIDWDRVELLDARGTQVEPLSEDRERGIVVLDVSQLPLTLTASDRAGNWHSAKIAVGK